MLAVIASNNEANVEGAGAVVTRGRVDGARPFRGSDGDGSDRFRRSLPGPVVVGYGALVDQPATTHYLAVDVGGARLAAGVVDDAGAVVVRDRVATPTRDVWPALARLVTRVVAAAPQPLSVCGVSTGGPIDRRTGHVSPLHVPSWRGFPLAEKVSELTELPTSVELTGRALALGERWCGAAVDVDDFVVVVASTAVDAGIVSHGRLLSGRLGNAGQIGHMVVDPGGRDCPCGAVGCLEAYTSSAAIEDETRRPLRRSPPAIIERTGILLGRTIASVLAIVDARLVLLAGSVPMALGAPLFDAVDRELEQRARLSHLRRLTVAPAGCGGDAPLIGAAAIAREARLAG
jgi:glucokinase